MLWGGGVVTSQRGETSVWGDMSPAGYILTFHLTGNGGDKQGEEKQAKVSSSLNHALPQDDFIPFPKAAK